jgi:hypothetical protein
VLVDSKVGFILCNNLFIFQVPTIGLLHSLVVSLNLLRTFLYLNCVIVNVSVTIANTAVFCCYVGLGWVEEISHLVSSVSYSHLCTYDYIRYILLMGDNTGSQTELLERLLLFFESPLHQLLFHLVEL